MAQRRNKRRVGKVEPEQDTGTRHTLASLSTFEKKVFEGSAEWPQELRLGEDRFYSSVERLGLVKKLKKLFELCDDMALADNDPMVITADAIAKRRNRLVHPRVEEIRGNVSGADRGGDKIPEATRESVADVDYFFEEFGKRQPAMAGHLPTWSQSPPQ